MFDINILKDVHFDLGPLEVNLGDKAGRKNFGLLLFVVGIVALIAPATPIGVAVPQILKDIFSSIGIIALIIGAILYRIR